MTPWVLRLLVANVAMYFVSQSAPAVVGELVLVPALILHRPWTLVTYMFLHGSVWHIFFNMLALFFFGPRLEIRLGGRHFLALYFASGIAGALLSFVFTPYAAIIGASGAVFGVLLGFARYWPRATILIWGIVPIEARWLVVLFTLVALYGGFSGHGGGIAHFAHLGGFLGGYLYLRWMEWRSPARRFRRQATARLETSRRPGPADLKRWSRIRPEELHEVNREELSRILEKIGSNGVASLSRSERTFLDRFSPRDEGEHV